MNGGLDEPEIQVRRKSDTVISEDSVIADLGDPVLKETRSPPAETTTSDDLVMNPFGGSTPAGGGVMMEIHNGSLFDAVVAFAQKNLAPLSLRAAKSSDAEAGPADSEAQLDLTLGFGETSIPESMGYGELVLTHQAFGKPHWAGGRFPTLVLASPTERDEVVANMKKLLRRALSEHERAVRRRALLPRLSARATRDGGRLSRRPRGTSPSTHSNRRTGTGKRTAPFGSGTRPPSSCRRRQLARS